MSVFMKLYFRLEAIRVSNPRRVTAYCSPQRMKMKKIDKKVRSLENFRVTRKKYMENMTKHMRNLWE